MSRTRSFEWHRWFKKGREDVEDDPRSGRPTTSRTKLLSIERKVRSDRRFTVKMMADELSKNSEGAHNHHVRYGDEKNLCKNGTKLLNGKQKKCRVQVCQDIWKELETEPDMQSRVVTGDVSRIFEYDPLIKRHSIE